MDLRMDNLPLLTVSKPGVFNTASRVYKLRVVRLIIFSTAAALLAAAAPPDRTVWDGVYTAAQATRGAAIYSSSCSSCHREGLPDRAAPAADGGRFMESWSEDTVKSLFTLIKTTMPRSAPASLSDAAYTDIVAYILERNAFPAGSEELVPDTLAAVRIQAKGGPEPVPNFALVRTSGCLTQGPDKAWMLTHATEPIRTRDPAEEANGHDPSAKTSGDRTFRLLQLYLGPEAGGRTVEAKGFLIRTPTEGRLNVTSVRTLAARCEE